MMVYLPNADVLYLSNNRPINDPKIRQAIVDFVNAGKGLIIAHAAMWYNWKDWPEYNLNLVSGGSRGHDKYGTFDVTVTAPQHPIMQNVEPKFSLKDERYYYIPDPNGPGIEVLASSSVAGSDKFSRRFSSSKTPKAALLVWRWATMPSHTTSPITRTSCAIPSNGQQGNSWFIV
jgi:type 1 glutamine amidotransferase